MFKLSDRWNSNWPGCFRNGYYSQWKGQLIEDIRTLERAVESKDEEILNLKFKIKVLENESNSEKLNNNILEENLLERIKNLEARVEKIELNEESETTSTVSVETINDYSLGWKEIDARKYLPGTLDHNN